jgi:hypothetical protein
MLRSNRFFVLATALAMLAIAVPSAVGARQKIPTQKLRDCLINGTVIPHGETLTVIDDENCATEVNYCTDGEVCGFIKWDAQCGDQDFGEAKVVANECYWSVAPSLVFQPVTPSGTFTTTKTPSANLSTWR